MMAEGRWAGGLLLVHTGIGTAFLLGWMPAGNGFTALIGLAMGFIPVAIALRMYRNLHRASAALAAGYLLLAGMACVVGAGEQMATLVLGAMRKVTEVTDSGRMLAVFLKNWSHTMALLFSGLAWGAFHGSVVRLGWVPRWVGAIALAAVALHLASAGRPFFDALVNYHLLYPLAAVQGMVGLWLLVRGGKYIEG